MVKTWEFWPFDPNLTPIWPQFDPEYAWPCLKKIIPQKPLIVCHAWLEGKKYRLGLKKRPHICLLKCQEAVSLLKRTILTILVICNDVTQTNLFIAFPSSLFSCNISWMSKIEMCFKSIWEQLRVTSTWNSVNEH